MFDLINYLCESIFGSTSSLNDDIFQYLSIHLRSIMKMILSESFLITLRSRRTRLIVEDLKTTLRCRNNSTLFGFSCEKRRNAFLIVVPREILVQVEWLAIAGQQICSPPMKSTRIDHSILRVEQQMFFSSLQSTRFDEKLFQSFVDDQLAIDICLSSLIDYFRLNISDCLLHKTRREKRRQLIRQLEFLNSFVKTSSKNSNFFLSNFLSMFVTCLFFDFDDDDDDDDDQWKIRLIAARGSAEVLKRTNFLLFDGFYLRTVARFVQTLRNRRTPPSLLYAICRFFQHLGIEAVRTFLLPQFIHIEPSNFFSSTSIRSLLEHFATIFQQ